MIIECSGWVVHRCADGKTGSNASAAILSAPWYHRHITVPKAVVVLCVFK